MGSSPEPAAYRRRDQTWVQHIPMPDLVAFGADYDAIQSDYDAQLHSSIRAEPDVDDREEGSPATLTDASAEVIRNLFTISKYHNIDYFNTIMKHDADLAALAHAAGVPDVPAHFGPEGESQDEGARPLHGLVRVEFGDGAAITTGQRRTLDWLIANQAVVAAEVRRCLAKTCRKVVSAFVHQLDDLDRTLLPIPGEGRTIEDYVRLDRVTIVPEADALGLHFDCAWTRVLESSFGEFVVVFYDSRIGLYGNSLAPVVVRKVLAGAPEFLWRRFIP